MKLWRHRDSSTILCIVNIQTSSLNTLLYIYIRLVLMKRNVSMGENVENLTARIFETRNASIINGITRFKYVCIYAHSWLAWIVSLYIMDIHCTYLEYIILSSVNSIFMSRRYIIYLNVNLIINVEKKFHTTYVSCDWIWKQNVSYKPPNVTYSMAHKTFNHRPIY